MSGKKCRGLKGFAAGGIVDVPGASRSGVADDIHVDDAPVGGFVLPADSVQALRRSNPELLAQILAVIQQAGGDADGAATAQIAISNGELFIPPEAVAALGGAEVLNAIKDATHQQVNAPSAKPIDAPPPPGGVNAPLDAVVQPPRGLPLGAASAVLPDAAMPGSGQAQQQRTFFKGGGAVARGLFTGGGMVRRQRFAEGDFVSPDEEEARKAEQAALPTPEQQAASAARAVEIVQRNQQAAPAQAVRPTIASTTQKTAANTDAPSADQQGEWQADVAGVKGVYGQRDKNGQMSFTNVLGEDGKPTMGVTLRQGSDAAAPAGLSAGAQVAAQGYGGVDRGGVNPSLVNSSTYSDLMRARVAAGLSPDGGEPRGMHGVSISLPSAPLRTPQQESMYNDALAALHERATTPLRKLNGAKAITARQRAEKDAAAEKLAGMFQQDANRQQAAQANTINAQLRAAELAARQREAQQPRGLPSALDMAKLQGQQLSNAKASAELQRYLQGGDGGKKPRFSKDDLLKVPITGEDGLTVDSYVNLLDYQGDEQRGIPPGYKQVGVDESDNPIIADVQGQNRQIVKRK